MAADLETMSRHARVAQAIEDLLEAIGPDPDPNLTDTPARVARYWAEATSGYGVVPDRHLRGLFPGPADPGLVVVSKIPVRTTCAHHLLPIAGTATVAYRGREGTPVVGLSKLARVVDGYARRLQLQEALGRQVADAVSDTLSPVGAACLITATHGCMTHRGVKAPTVTLTQALTGSWHPMHHDVMAVTLAHHAPERDGG